LITDPITPIDVAIQPATYTANLHRELRLRSPETPPAHPLQRVWVVSAEEVPADVPVDTYQHVPWRANLTEDGRLDTAGALWTRYEEGGVPYFCEVVCYSDDVAEATVTYFVLRLLGWPRVMVYLPENAGL
jgi:hypothetical protein